MAGQAGTFGPRELAEEAATLGALPAGTVVSIGGVSFGVAGGRYAFAAPLVADGANDVVISPAAAGASPTIATEGTDTTVGLTVVLKGNGPFTVAGQTFNLGTNTTAASVRQVVNGASGVQKSFEFWTGGLSRWTFGCSDAAETGANAGSGFFVNSYSDSGAFLATPFYITRADGTVGINKVYIGSGFIDNTVIGGTTASTGRFTTLTLTATVAASTVLAGPASGSAAAAPAFRQLAAADVSGLGTLATANAATPPALGSTTPAGAAFTTLSASSTVSGTGFSTYLAAPPAIGGTTPAAGTFAALAATGYTYRSGATGLTAAGTTQATAYAITRSISVFGTVASGSGAVLPNLPPVTVNGVAMFAEFAVTNTGANALLLYPASGLSINALAANAALSVAAGATVRGMQHSTANYRFG